MGRVPRQSENNYSIADSKTIRVFLRRIEQARNSLRAGRGGRLEGFEKK